MATTPTPAPVAPVTWITHYTAWIKAHEKLLIILLATFLLYRGGQGVENLILKHDAKTATQAAIVVQQDTTSNKALLDQLAQMKADAAVQQKTINASLALAQSALAAQQKKDAASTPTEINARWQILLPMKPGSVKSIDSSTTAITNDAANLTVQALEEIAPLRNQVVGLTAELSIDQGIINQQDNTIAGLNKQIVDEKASHVADVNLEKVKAKRSFWRGFKYGVVVGIVAIEAVRIWAGHP